MTEPVITCIGISHNTASLALREELCCTPDLIYHAWANWPLADTRPMSELALIATCNRLELYAVHDACQSDSFQTSLELLSFCAGRPLDELAPHLYALSGPAAVDHLFRVAAGLESQVLGEAQILGQVSETYTGAIKAGAMGPYLSALFQAAIRAGKRARAETAIGRNPVSLSSTAITAAQHIFSDLQRRPVLIIGAGEMAQLAVKALLAKGVTQISIANRTLERATHLAAAAGGKAFSLGELPHILPMVDVVISATGAPHAVIDRALIEAAALSPDHRLLLVDIALPRDIDPDVRQLPGVQVMDMDDLKRQVDKSLLLRQAEMPRVEKIIAEEREIFEERLRYLVVTPVISDLRQKAEMIRQRELERATRHLGPLDEETTRQLELFSRSLVKKLLHEPTINLRDIAGREDDPTEYVRTFRELFGLEGANG